LPLLATINGTVTTVSTKPRPYGPTREISNPEVKDYGASRDAFCQLASGSYAVMARATASVFGPRLFW
jgi:hypothetical protein